SLSFEPALSQVGALHLCLRVLSQEASAPTNDPGLPLLWVLAQNFQGLTHIAGLLLLISCYHSENAVGKRYIVGKPLGFFHAERNEWAKGGQSAVDLMLLYIFL